MKNFCIVKGSVAWLLHYVPTTTYYVLGRIPYNNRFNRYIMSKDLCRFFIYYLESRN